MPSLVLNRDGLAAWLRASLLAAAGIAVSAWGQDLVYESEPNDTPADFTPIAGEVLIAGTLRGVDQDGFLWTVSDADAERPWTFRLDGIPGALTIIQVFRLEYAENGVDVVAREKLFGMGSRDGSQPVFERDLLFDPGRYVVGFAYAGGDGVEGGFRPPKASIAFGDGEAAAAGPDEAEPGGYRAGITAGRSLSPRAHRAPPVDRETAQDLRPGRSFASFVAAETSWYRLELDAAQADELWELRGQLPVGQEARVFLRDAAGAEVSETTVDDFGRFRFTDLGLAAGAHFLEIRGQAANMIRVVESRTVGQRVQGAEAEENRSWETANTVDWSVPVTGHLATSGDSDTFRFHLDEAGADEQLALVLETGPDQAVQLCLLDGTGDSVQCRKASGTVTLPKLALTPGAWGVLVSRGPEGAEYRLRLDRQGPIEPEAEVEPNDAVASAVTLPAKNRIRGRFDTDGDVDFYRFLVTDEAQLWRFQAIGDELHRIVYYDGAGQHGQEFREVTRRLRLDNVFLLPGQHFIAVHGKPGTDYTLLARPLGPPDPDGEREPNDTAAQTQPIALGQRRNGLLSTTADLDRYRFTLFDWEHLRISIEPPADGDVRVHLYWDEPNYFTREQSGVGESLVYEGLFPPGAHVISLGTRTPSDAEYHVAVERLDRFGCPVDCEPNSSQAFASPVPPSGVIEGRNAGWDADDAYALPVPETPQALEIRAEKPYRLAVREANATENLVAWDEARGAFLGTLPAGVPTYLHIEDATDGYRLALAFEDGPAPLQSPAPPTVELDLALDAEAVRAYGAYGQQVTGAARLTNTGSEDLVLDLEAVTSDRRWRVSLGKARLTLPAGQSAQVPVTVTVPRDAWALRDLRVSLRAGNRGGHVSTHRDVRVDTEAAPVAPMRHYSLPAPLLGGFNVAGQRFGGRWAGDYDTSVGWNFEQAIDGLAIRSNGPSLRGGYRGETAELVIDLAGETPVNVAGVVLHSLNGGTAHRYLRVADVAVSDDGETWTPVLFAPLEPVGGEQAFVLDAPVAARFARLMLEYNWSGAPRAGEALGEFQVIATPGFDVSGGKGFNLGEKALGGHVVWARPAIDAYWNDGLLQSDQAPSTRIDVGTSQSWVVAFHHNRAARLERLEWVHAPDEAAGPHFTSVQVSASMDSPLGPWTPVGEWVLDPASTVDTFRPKAPFWARFVKFTTNPVEVWDRHPLPTPLRLWESPTSGDYRSVLTEWGLRSRQAFWESTRPVPPEPSLERAPNDARERAAPLAPEAEASGAVRLGEHEHWYRFEMPADQNTLMLDLTGHPTVRTEVTAETATGERIVLRRLQADSNPAHHRLEGVVDPGATVYLRVREPRRNVVFAWDTSGSVTPYLPIINNALLSYAQDVQPGMDAVNYLPFGRSLLLEDWYGESYVLQTVLNDYPRRESSSAAERTLADASRALAPRAGTKAIVLITDAATGVDRALWGAFDKARPRVFALGVSSEGAFSRNPHREADLMADWASVNGGHYSHLLTDGEVEVAFQRAQTLLRAPAPYGLRAGTAYREAPGPGTLVVTAEAGQGAASGGAVELILDASGSMLQRLGGKRRIAIAREVLTEAVRDWIPEGTPVALRVFGHREPNACRTDLEAPLAPLDRAAMAEKIAAIDAMNLAKTPIADALLAAGDDLAGAEGRVSLLLLTDGEETCEGDPAEAIEALRAQGVKVNLNIVGFAIDDAATEALFVEWAEAGGGAYFAATDQAGLAAAVNAALKAPFTVYDPAGARVATGRVGGEPLALEAGYYRVVVAGAPPRVFEDVEVAGESETRLTLD